MRAVILAFAIIILIGMAWAFWDMAHAHEHMPGESAEEARTIEFLRSWKRPKGPYSIEHRMSSCCYISGQSQDCFPVKQTRIVNGWTEVFPDVEGHEEYAHWYRVPAGISEIEQPDPRESPDGRSYVCVAGQNVICYVPGNGS